MTLRQLLDEIAEIDWRHPAWWGLLAGTAMLERLARDRDGALYPIYLAANGGPRADTFMGRDAPPPRGVSGRARRAVARARAATATLARLDGAFPEQPLACGLRWRDGWLAREPASLDHVAYLTPRGRLVAPIADGEGPLLRHLAGEPVPSSAASPAIAVSLCDHDAGTARHLHRAAWIDRGGPWLGVGQAGSLEVVTTCHFAVDGYGHGRIAAEIFAALGASPPEEGPHDPWPPAPVAGAETLGIAAERIAPVRTARAAYALGRILHRLYGNGGRFSPTFQVPVAPGRREDPDRRRRRVLFALASVKRDEPFEAFAHRLDAIAAREADGGGVLTRILRATSQAPLPRRLRRRLLTSDGRTHPRIPPIEVLAGRGSLSVIRYPEGERPPAPLYAVSSPALAAPPHDPLGAVVLTLIHHGDAATATLCGNGLAGTSAGARRVLDAWLDELEPDLRR